MKKTCLLLSFLVTFITLKAQDSTLPCGVPDMDTSEFTQLPWFDNNQLLEDFLDSIGYPRPNARIMDDVTKYRIPVKFWIYRDDNGNGGPTLIQIQKLMDDLNHYYNGLNNTWIGFYMKCQPTYINNTANISIHTTGANLLFLEHSENGCINVHIVQNIHGSTVGYSVPGTNSVLIDENSYLAGPYSSLAHEIGHIFGLVHTHQYSTVVNARRCFVECVSRTRNWPFTSLCFKNRFKKVCESTGDALKDTPADPNLLNNSTPDCSYALGGTDPWGDAYPPNGSEMPETANIMSYNGNDNCVNHFSRLQIAVMLRTIKWHKIDHTYWNNNGYIFDSYEPDNNSETARAITLNEIQEHNFHQQFEYNGWGPTTTQCDVDWVRFTPVCSGNFTIETAGISGRTNTNTRLTLFDNNLNQLAQNDDISVSNLYSNIGFNFNSGSTYFIRVENMMNGTTGYYQLSVKYAPQINGLDIFCGQTTYTIPNLPIGAAVSWSVVPNGIVTPTTYNGNSFTVTGNVNGDFTMTAQVNACGQNYTLTKTAHVGPPVLFSAQYTYNGSQNPLQFYSGPSSYNPLCVSQSTDVNATFTGANSVTWSKVSSSSTVAWNQNGNDLIFYLWAAGQTAVFNVQAANGCGNISYTFGFQAINCGGGGGGCAKYAVTNTDKSSLRVVVPNIPPPCRVASVNKDSTDKDIIALVKVYDMSGRLLIKQNFSNAKTASINSDLLIPGVYVIEISDGKNIDRQKIVVLK